MPSGCGWIHGRGKTTFVAGHGQPGHVYFRVQAPASASLSTSAPLSGRVLIFLKPGGGDSAVDANEFSLGDIWVASREVRDLAPGASVEVEADESAYPKPFSALPPGKYEAQAVLDVDHTYNYSGRSPKDWMSGVAALGDWTPSSGAEPVLTLDRHPGKDWKRTAMVAAGTLKAKLIGVREEELASPSLSRFLGRPAAIKAWVILPPGYSATTAATYPTVYWTHGFGGGIDGDLGHGLRIWDRMKSGKLPPMIWVMLDESIPQGTHEFADSANDGPWGTALTTEFIPYLEGKYRMDARPSGRLLNGHSSGGWATLQLQVNYPKIFGGTWSTSPDSSDFHDFTGVDLYAVGANMYRRPDGSPVPIMRDQGKVLVTMEQLGRLEPVLGPYGGQLQSFEWVFSPRGGDGVPQPMFDRATGAVDPAVVAYWREHWDLARVLDRDWAQRGADLKGKIHVTVGTADSFYLDGAAHRLDAVLAKLGGGAEFRYLPGRTHFDLYAVGGDAEGLFDQIGAEMYTVARPGTSWKRR